MGRIIDGGAPPLQHHVTCRCPECELDREIDAAFISAGMVGSAVAVETGEAGVVEGDE